MCDLPLQFDVSHAQARRRRADDGRERARYDRRPRIEPCGECKCSGIDSAAITHYRSAREGQGFGTRIFSRPIIYERFPKCNAHRRRNVGRDRSFISLSFSLFRFFLFSLESTRRSRDASSGRKTRRPASGH